MNTRISSDQREAASSLCGQPDSAQLDGTVASVAARVERLAEQAGHQPPVLALGVFERVGSNWLSDSLRQVMPQHNEPFRQQLSRAHPLSPSDRVPPTLQGTGLTGLGRHQLVCALSDLHGEQKHLVKETNLFFAADTVLGLLPQSPAIVLTRAPVGIAASFARGRLWDRWRYKDRYAQVSASARAPRWRAAFAGLLPADDPDPSTALGRLIAVNALLLARALHDPVAGARPRLVIPYERHVADREGTLSGLAGFLDVTAPVTEEPRSGPERAAVDATFATSGHKGELVAELPPGEAALVGEAVAATLDQAGQVLDGQVTRTAVEWLAGGDLYEVRAPAARPAVPTRPVPVPHPAPQPAYRPAAPGAGWRNLLVSNAELAELLTLLHAGGAPNSRLGTHLLVCPMPHERGGRLHFDAKQRQWRVSRGFEDHPAYWVTWVGAALMAAWCGARLPTRAEVLEATSGASASNCEYVIGDTCSVAEPGLGREDVHHLVGNVQVWCADGPQQPCEQPVQRYMAGAAWNTPGTWEAVSAVRSRYLLGSSRGVGVRLVRDGHTTDAAQLGAWELANLVNRWVTAADSDAHTTPGALDRLLLDALGS
ncbi:SUMF1/EgtB/PvdO family nonheme iron enzyme [Streptomyces sp. NPDC005728]|uniref:SUMF1/EgtB/PvdO family nonheme iron enzyme n=1 Tax=Streptomyces sp. NPDC005728 TaxID=3157054 RepID=UPI0033D89DA1